MMAVIWGMPSALATALWRKTRPKSSMSGKTSSCSGRKTPAESTRYISGRWFSSAMAWQRSTFLAVMGKKAPALTVASLAMTMVQRPAIWPRPQTTPAATAPPHSSYMPQAAKRPISSRSVPGSRRRAMRSRAVRRDFSCWRTMAAAPPPWRSRASSWRSSRTRSSRDAVGMGALLCVHGGEEVAVALGLEQAIAEQLHGLGDRERVQHLAQHPDAVEVVLGDEQLLFARAGALDVNRGEDALVHELAVEDDLHVAGALELLEDDLVHAAAGLDQRGGDDGERAAFLDVAGGAEEALGALQGVGVHAAGEDLARGRNDGVVGAGEAGDGVEQDDHVALVLDQALGLFDHHLGDLDVAAGGLVEGRADDFALDRALHVGDFFRALVNQQHHQHHLGVVGGDGVGDGLQQHGLAGAGRGDDQPSLALADGGAEVHDAARDVLADGLELDALGRIERGEVVEEDLVAGLFGGLEVDGLDLGQGEVLLALVRRADLARAGVAGAQIEAADLRGRDVDVVGAGKIVVVGRAQEAVAVGEDFEHALGEDVALFFALRLE